MHTRLPAIKKQLFNKRNLSSASFNISHQYQNKKIMYSNYPNVVMHYTTSSKQQLRIQAPVYIEELPDLSIEKMVASLTPLELATLKIFNSGSMSYGSISLEAHTTLAEALNRINLAIHGVKTIEELKKLPGFHGPVSGSGEGGELRFRNDTLWQSLMRQIASGRFGVTSEYLAQCTEIQIKIAQGAKPGVGGELPGKKVTIEVAFARLTEQGTTLVSPALNHDVSSIEDLKQLIHDLRSANPRAVISVKLVATDGIGVIAVGTAKCGADSISIAGPGGTGAATLPAKHELTLPPETSVAESHQALIEEGLRDGVRLTMSGGIQTGEECFIALCLGADGIELGTEMLVALGCVNAKKCHNDLCPTGIATNDQTLIDEKFKGKPEHVARVLIELAKSTAAHIEKYGYSHPSQVVGQTQHLQVKKNAPVTGLEKLLYKPINPYLSAKLEKSKGSSYLEQTVIWDIAKGKSTFHLPALNSVLSFGARIAFHTHDDQEFKKAFFAKPVVIRFNGVACGQSLGFVAINNLTMVVENANDGTGKSLDGATIYVKNVAGNQTGYGATRGDILTRATGDHAFVRNSGAHLVCEVMGEMGVNFMTGGTATIFGTPDCFDGLKIKGKYRPPVQLRKDIVGPNFGASFTGGRVFLPKKLYDSMYHHNYLASPADMMVPQDLSDAEVDVLIERLKQYAKEMPNALINALLKCDKLSLKKMFIKLDPKVTYKISPPQDSSVALLAIPQAIETITPAHRDKVLKPYMPEKNLLRPIEAKHADKKPGLHQPERERDACGTGVLVNRKGNASRIIVESTLKMLIGYMHRGATGVDFLTGDGCGISWFGTHHFFAKKFPDLQLKKGNHGIVHIALPQDKECNERAQVLLSELLKKENLEIAGGRDVPINSSVLGYIGKKTEPAFKQFVIKKPESVNQQEFEKQLIRIKLQFELLMQKEKEENRPHILSASSYHVIYKSLVREDKFGEYFLDLLDKHFVASTGVAHSRFSTNTLPKFKNIQPLKFANNGENNALQLLVNLLSKDPLFKNLLGIESIDLSELSDSHIMSIYMDMLHLLGYTVEEIVASTIQRYEPEAGVRSSDFYNLFGVPFEGPNASIIMMNDKIIVVGDKNSYRPKHGIMNDKLLYLGSELGPVEMTGNNIDLPPATPLIIDLDKNEVGIYQPEKSVQAFHQRQMSSLLLCKPDFNSPEPILFGESDLKIRKIRAGWTEELHEYFMRALYKEEGKSLLSSMGNQGPAEPFVRGAYNDIYAYFYAKFSQVTNPPLAIKEEKAYMSMRVFVGKKPQLWDVGDELVDGYELPSPIVNNYEMELLKKSELLRTHVVDCIFPTHEKTENMELYIQKIAEECVNKVASGVTFLVLSDIQSDHFNAALPPVIVASCVHDALLKAGLRRNVTLALQASSVLTGREAAQVISIGGVDVINPYLAFIPSAKNSDITAFRKQCDAYQASLTQEVLGFMARMGISTVSAYRGTKGFYSYGINSVLASMLGISSIFGGVGLKEIARMIVTWHQRPKHDGWGRYDLQQPEREGIWSPQNTSETRKVAEGKGDWALAEKNMNALKTGFPRGWLQLKPSQVWNRKNPMPVLIMGGGAAGLNVAKELLASGMSVAITIIERNVVNPIGLVGNGVAPDHTGTKNQGKLLREVFEDNRVKYYGGIEIGDDVTMKELQSRFACIIDCCGASTNRMLNVEGESLRGVVSADEVYKAYNNAYPLQYMQEDWHSFFARINDEAHNNAYPLEKVENDWAFFPASKNDEMVIIGNGNVAADVTRILLNKDLDDTPINPRFLSALQQHAPSIIRVIGIETPDKTRISLNQLENLAAKKVWMTAHFDVRIDESKLNETERKLYQFFLKIKDNTPPISYGQQIHFHFDQAVKSFEQKSDEIEAIFLDSKNKELVVRAKSFIKAIGTVPNEIHHHVMMGRPAIYECGWRTGQGGTLKSAQESALQTVEKIKRAFYQNQFNHLKLEDKIQMWQVKSSVNNQEQLNILAYLDDRNFINTPDDFILAKQYKRKEAVKEPQIEEVKQEQIKPAAIDVPISNPNVVTLFNPKTKQKREFEPSDKTLLQAMKDSGSSPECACGGELICGDCRTKIFLHPNEDLPPPSKKAAALHKLYPGLNLFACEKTLNDLKGAVLEDPAVVDANKSLRS